ncbi:carboxypeptidase-like regulatory domain-containing protein [Actinoplanes sp. CA-252034]|uniref:carboxypeptidase-like regulatory domain-containing protein n=1 Tax=Actinoplanes sp. CA-252034 TaxID=3239906 RepID=UPI003D965F4C
MTTRLRARWARAAALLALTGGTLAVAATPAAGAPAPIKILSVSAENVEPGDKVRVRFRVTNTGSAAETAIVVVGAGLKCTTGCRAEPNLGAGKSRDFEATVVAPAAAAGETSGLNISVAVRLGGQNSFDFKMVYVHGSGAGAPETEKPVDRVTGRVRDAGGKAVGGVALAVRDSEGHEYRTTSEPNGRFTIKSTAAKPISVGSIKVAAAKDGYRTARATVQGAAGDTASVQVTLTALAAPTRTSSSPAAKASPLAAVDEPEPEKTIIGEAAPNLEKVSDEGSGVLPFVVGGLLVVVGVGALALLVGRRRKTP